jgi:hypothetical protein
MAGGIKIRITTERRPFHDGRPLEVGEEVTVSEAEAAHFMENGFAETLTKTTAKKATKTKKVRARKDGKFVADNPGTHDINEAWITVDE